MILVMSAQEILNAALELTAEERTALADKLYVSVTPVGFVENDTRLLLAIKSFEKGKLTLGQAASLANYSKAAFMEILAQEKVPIADYSIEELAREREM